MKFDIVILGLSVTSSWGNGHATTYRGLIEGLAGQGRRVLFLERDQPWYAENRDLPQPPGAVTELYHSLAQLQARFEEAVSRAALVIVGSYVPDGVLVGDWVLATARGVVAFYDIDTPITLSKLDAGEQTYIAPSQIPQYHCYLSFTGGPTLQRLEKEYGAPLARPLYCSVDADLYRPYGSRYLWDLGYLGTHSSDRQPSVEAMLLQSAAEWPKGRFMVCGPGYSDTDQWPLNVEHRSHLSPLEHPFFYGSQRFTLNLTRSAMKTAGFSPSVRLFEAAACGTPIISDWWDGLDSVFALGSEVLLADSADAVLRHLRDLPESQRLAIASAARQRVLAEHTPHHRATQLENYLKEVHEYVFADSSRRDQRQRKIARRAPTGMALEPNRLPAGGATGRASVSASNPGSVHKPAGAHS